MRSGWKIALIEAVRKSGWRVDEICGLTRISESTFYRILTGDEQPGVQAQHAIADAVGRPVNELFPK
jgi:hypothetical protein